MPDRSLRELTGYCLSRATGVVTTEFNHVFSAFGLRRTTFSALALIVDNPGLRQSQLAEALAIDRPNMVQIVDELEAAKWVQRNKAKDDRRAYALQPTEAGKTVFRNAMRAALEQDIKLTKGMSSAEKDILRRALWKIQRNAKKVQAPGQVQL